MVGNPSKLSPWLIGSVLVEILGFEAHVTQVIAAIDHVAIEQLAPQGFPSDLYSRDKKRATLLYPFDLFGGAKQDRTANLNTASILIQEGVYRMNGTLRVDGADFLLLRPPNFMAGFSCEDHWLHSLAEHWFNGSHQDIEDLPFERGITVSHERIRLWRIKFGAIYAKRLGKTPEILRESGVPFRVLLDVRNLCPCLVEVHLSLAFCPEFCILHVLFDVT